MYIFGNSSPVQDISKHGVAYVCYYAYKMHDSLLYFTQLFCQKHFHF